MAIIFLLIFAGLEFYLFNAFRGAFANTIWAKLGMAYVAISVITFVITYFRVIISFRSGIYNATLTNNLLMGFSFSFFLTNFVLIAVFFAEDIFRIFDYIWQLLPIKDTGETSFASRRQFIGMTATLLAAVPFASLIYGVLQGRYNYKVFPVPLKFADLPKAFDGFKIVQISDVHSGSFDNIDEVERAVGIIQAQKPDMIVFTGDWVNTFAEELKPYISIFKALEAPFGKYAIWGNHDYGHRQDGQSNIGVLRNFVNEAGFTVLENENVKIEKDGETFRLVGVENWGKPPFPQIGDLQKAKGNIEKGEFSILLSHDPTHWDAKVIEDQHHFHLTLSGHTHGAQIGIEAKWLRWSPSKYIYPRWAGIYEEKGQYLYVNRGFGFLAYPGRAGINPEITAIELKKGEMNDE
ncbi:MAG: metallophosphoesterase [Saprospiraceae bacterium]|nr:metallophosphoesterase [Saprospiraceae bacterium]